MERFTFRESVLLGYSPQRSFENPSSSSEAALINSDVDFDDVFGGPPRRASLHERRYRNNSEETVLSRSSLSGLSEKPVFGEESVNRRRYPSDDFFDDIFGGEDSHGSPRRSDRDPSCSTPGSRFLSPARSLTPRADTFATSLPPQFSLPAKVTKAFDAPTFASSSTYSTNASLSIFLSQAARGQDELRNEVRPSYRQSPLSHEFSLRSKESTYVTKSNEKNAVGSLKEDSKGGDVPSSPEQFHFSMYKWAGIGVPLVRPLRRRSTPKGKDKIERRVDSDLSTAKVRDADSFFLNHGTSTSTEPFKVENEKKDKSSTRNRVETPQMVEEAVIKKKEPESLDISQSTIKNVSGGSMLKGKREETKAYTLPDIGIDEGTDKIISMVTQEARKPHSKPLHSLLPGEIEGQGNEGKGNVVQMEKASHANVSAGKNVKNNKGQRTNSSRPEANEAGMQSTPIINSGENLRRNGAKGKVKEFVGIFNQETSSKPKITVDSTSQSSRWKGISTAGADYEESVSTSKADKKMHLPNLTKTQDASVLVDENVEQSKKQRSHLKTGIHRRSDNSSGRKDAPSFSESHPHGSKITIENLDDLLQEDFRIEELPHDQETSPETSEEYDAIRVSDAKIQQWSNGKKGNIRSLLSTLQFVLWPGSGWKPVPLVDVIEGSAVKKAYQRALLCLHPDKLQQKGAAADKKYIAEKVFDILQEAWDHFNSMGSL